MLVFSIMERTEGQHVKNGCCGADIKKKVEPEPELETKLNNFGSATLQKSSVWLRTIEINWQPVAVSSASSRILPGFKILQTSKKLDYFPQKMAKHQKNSLKN